MVCRRLWPVLNGVTQWQELIDSGVTAAAPVLWLFMISATFARHNGLFIAPI